MSQSSSFSLETIMESSWMMKCESTAISYLWIGILVVVVYHLLTLVRKVIEYHRSPLWQIPGPPKASWLTGHFLGCFTRPYMEPHLEWIAQAGGFDKVNYIHYTGFFGEHSVLVLDADQIQKILLSNPKTPPRYLKKYDDLRQVFGDGLASLEGDDWHRHRRLIHPSFQPAFLMKILAEEVPPRVHRFVQCWKQVGSNRELDLAAHYSLLTLDIIGQVAFHHDFQGLNALEQWVQNKDDPSNPETPKTQDKLIQSLEAATEPTLRRFLLNVLLLHSYKLLDRESHELIQSMNDAVDGILARAKERQRLQETASSSLSKHDEEEQEGRSSSSKYAAKSILQLLLDAQTSWTDLELRDEIKTFLVAGHETTSTLCYWATYVLTKYPDVQQRLYEEVSTKPSQTLEEIQQLPYLDAFLKEVLRAYSPAGSMVRFTTQEETFGTYRIPADTRLYIPLYLIHHNPRYWEDPDTFYPERWLKAEKHPASHKYAYLPFSAGPHSCIGSRLAALEAKLILASVVREFMVELAPSLKDEEISLTCYLVLKAKPSLKVVVKERHP